MHEKKHSSLDERNDLMLLFPKWP